MADPIRSREQSRPCMRLVRKRARIEERPPEACGKIHPEILDLVTARGKAERCQIEKITAMAHLVNGDPCLDHRILSASGTGTTWVSAFEASSW